LTYVLNLTQRTSLLTRSRPPSYRKDITPQNWVRNWKHNGKHETVQARVTSEPMTTLSPSQVFHRTPCGHARETTMGAQQEQEKLEPLDQWIKNRTGFHLQQSTYKRHLDLATKSSRAEMRVVESSPSHQNQNTGSSDSVWSLRRNRHTGQEPSGSEPDGKQNRSGETLPPARANSRPAERI
jgi:hypothetical protein